MSLSCMYAKRKKKKRKKSKNSIKFKCKIAQKKNCIYASAAKCWAATLSLAK